MFHTSPTKIHGTRVALSTRSKSTHIVRIIGGNWKRTPLPVLNLGSLRPTPSRVRETLFNWLGQRLDGQRCIDLFAGSGALGFEAASRGAAYVLMIERNAHVAAQLRANQARLSAQAIIKIAETDALCLAIEPTSSLFDIVFLDPPFRDDSIFKLAFYVATSLLRTNGFLYVETSMALDATNNDMLAGWIIARYGRAGAVHYHLLQRRNEK